MVFGFFKKIKCRFKIGQIVKNPYGQFGEVVKIYEKKGVVMCTLDGDMYPYDYPALDLRLLTKREKGA